ncbi:MAG TPA: hypothetical protein VLN41_02490 [Candidatus Bathyarchaeia archaeon]|nr:hypothetical protein [Candidatus Bathyarchaeia archaeon]
MKRSLALTILALAALAVLPGSALSQTPAPAQAAKKTDVVGTWRGPALVNDGAVQLEVTVVIGLAELGYTGKISDTNGMVPETDLRQIAFKDNKLTFEFDFAQSGSSTLIRMELLLDKGTLKGLWFDPDGNSGTIELTLQK